MKREQIIAQALGLLLAAGDDRHGVVAGDAAEHIGQLHRVDGRTRRVGEPRQPLHTISSVESLAECPLRPNPDGSGEIDLPADFLRLARLRMDGWQRPVLVALPEDHPAATYQYHPVTRGGMAKPVVLLTHGGTKLRYSSITGTDHHIAEGEYIPYKGINDIYPEKLIDVTAWTLAALVLGVSNEPAGAQAADKRASEILSLL